MPAGRGHVFYFVCNFFQHVLNQLKQTSSKNDQLVDQTGRGIFVNIYLDDSKKILYKKKLSQEGQEVFNLKQQKNQYNA